MAIIGSIEVRVSPDLSGFKKELQAGLASIKATVNVGVRANISAARAEVAAFTAQASKDVVKHIKVDVDKDATARLSGITSAVGGLGRSVVGLGGSLTKVAGGLGALSGALSIVGTVGPLLVQAAGAAALLPAALAPLAGAFAAVKLGTDGIKRAFEGLKPTVDGLKTAVSASFEKSLTPAVNNLKAVLPGLQVGLQSMATTLGGVATQFTAMLKSGSNTQALNSILIVSSQVVKNLGAALAPVGQAFINIAEIGLPVIKQLTEGAGAAAQRFADWTASAEGATRITEIINGSIAAFKEIGAILSNVGGIISGVFEGLQAGGAGLGTTLSSVLGPINAFVNSAAGFELFKAVGQTLSTVGGVISDVLGEALRALAPVLPPLLSAFSTLASAIGSALTPIIQALSPVLTTVANAINMVVVALTPMLEPISQMITSLMPPLNALFTALAPVISQVAGVVSTLVSALAPLVGTILGAAVQLITPLVPIIGTLAGVFGQVVSAVQPLIPPLQDLINAILPPLVELIGALAPVLTMGSEMFASLVSAVLPLLQPLIELVGALLPPLIKLVTAVIKPVGELAGKMSGTFKSAIDTAVGAIKNVIDWFKQLPDRVSDAINAVIVWVKGLPQRILDALGNLGNLLLDSGRALIEGLWKGIQAAKDWIVGKVKGVMDSIRALFPFSPAKVGPFSGTGYVTFSGKAIAKDFGTSLIKEFPGITRDLGYELEKMQRKFDSAIDVTGLNTLGNLSPLSPSTGAEPVTVNGVTVTVNADDLQSVQDVVSLLSSIPTLARKQRV